MIASVRPLLLVAALALVCVPVLAQQQQHTVTTHRRAEERAEVAKLRRRGRSCYRQRHYRCALRAFEQAQTLAPSAAMQFNVASAHDKLGNITRAVSGYWRYLDRVGQQVRPKISRFIDQRLQVLLPKVGQLALRVRPARARVKLQKKAQALVPNRTDGGSAFYRLALRPGRYQILVTGEDLAPRAVHVELSPGRLREIEAQLLARQRFGKLRVESDPPRAEVWFDGKRQEKRTPLLIERVAAGEHALQLYTDTHSYEGMVSIKPDETLTKSMTLSAAAGRISVATTPSKAAVRVDGSSVGRSPTTVGNLSLGKHTVEIEHDGFLPAREQVTLTSRQSTADLSLTLEPGGLLQLTSYPEGASIRLDGEPRGSTPQHILVVAGRHHVELTRSGYRDASYQVAVAPGETQKLSAVLQLEQELRQARRRKAVWATVMGSIGAAALLAAGTLYTWGALDGSAQHDAYEASIRDADRVRYADGVRSAESVIVAGHVMLGTSVVALGVSLYQWLSTPDPP
jgi:hypothetical protein